MASLLFGTHARSDSKTQVTRLTGGVRPSGSRVQFFFVTSITARCLVTFFSKTSIRRAVSGRYSLEAFFFFFSKKCFLFFFFFFDFFFFLFSFKIFCFVSIATGFPEMVVDEFVGWVELENWSLVRRFDVSLGSF